MWITRLCIPGFTFSVNVHHFLLYCLHLALLTIVLLRARQEQEKESLAHQALLFLSTYIIPSLLPPSSSFNDSIIES